MALIKKSGLFGNIFVKEVVGWLGGLGILFTEFGGQDVEKGNRSVIRGDKGEKSIACVLKEAILILLLKRVRDKIR